LCTSAPDSRNSRISAFASPATSACAAGFGAASARMISPWRVLVLTRDRDGAQQLLRWNGRNQVFPIFGLPNALNRTFLCWQP